MFQTKRFRHMQLADIPFIYEKNKTGMCNRERQREKKRNNNEIIISLCAHIPAIL